MGLIVEGDVLFMCCHKAGPKYVIIAIIVAD